MYRMYGALLRLAWSAALPYQIVTALLTGRRCPRLGERLGEPPGRPAPRPGGLWIHAVSVGEVRLALPLIARLRERFPGLASHLTTVTTTGRALAEEAMQGRGSARPDSVSDLPFDLAGSMGRLLGRLEPAAVLIVETEIWPNLLRACGRRGVPVMLVNGRISPAAHARYRLVRGCLGRVLRDVSLFLMQSEEDAGRILDLGAPPERVRVTGNIKYDIPIPDAAPGDLRRRLGLSPGEPLFVAGSTAPGEEDPVLEAFHLLRGHDRSTRLVLAPRHPERFARAEAALRRAGLRVALWSHVAAAGAVEPAGPLPSYDALLLDAVGVLPRFYAVADVVFVGGSLVARGGHNLLEPAALGKPVLFGPHTDNFRAIARALTDAGAGFVARDGRELGALAVNLLSDRVAYAVASTMARKVVEANRGALDRTLAMLAEALPARRLPSGIAAARA